MNIVIYDVNTGLILRRGNININHIDIQVKTDEEFYLNCPESATHIINNEPVERDIPKTVEELEHLFIQAIQDLLDKTAQNRGYDGIVSLCSYATSTDAVFGVEGRAGVAWRDAVWKKGNEMRSAVKSGTRSMPTIEELLLELPVMTWGE